MQTTITDLTPHQLAVANLVSGGLSNLEAATELGVSVKTVEYHLGRVFAKLGVRSRSQLMLRMLERTPWSGDGLRA
jgi:DNA-binding NarL/FixJ family response regulator